MKIILCLSVSTALCIAMEENNPSSLEDPSKALTVEVVDGANLNVESREKDITPVSNSNKQDSNEMPCVPLSDVERWVRRLSSMEQDDSFLKKGKENNSYTEKTKHIDELIFWINNSYDNSYGSVNVPNETKSKNIQTIIDQLRDTKKRLILKNDENTTDVTDSYNTLKKNLMKLLGHKENSQVPKEQFYSLLNQLKRHIHNKVEFYTSLTLISVDYQKKEWSEIPVLKDLKTYINRKTINDQVHMTQEKESDHSNLNEVFELKAKAHAHKVLEEIKDQLRDQQLKVIEKIPREKFNKWSQRLRYVSRP